MKIVRILPIVCVLATIPLATPRADEGHSMSTAAKRTLSYCHLYADDKGVSHFRDVELPFDSTSSTGTGPPLGSLTLPGSQGAATLLLLPRGAKEDWHKAPRRMYLVALKGMSEVTVGDGTVRRFAPGSVLLMDDLTGKGHITRAVGTEDHVALTIAAPQG
jgi:quercetin dioxygenase-like cupin family protein